MTTIHTTTGKLRNIFTTINGLAIENPETGAQRKLPAKVSYWVARLLSKLQGEYELSEKARLALAEEFGVKNEEGTQYNFTEESGAKFTARWNEILETEIELDLPTIRIDQLESIALEPGVFIALDTLVID